MTRILEPNETMGWSMELLCKTNRSSKQRALCYWRWRDSLVVKRSILSHDPRRKQESSVAFFLYFRDDGRGKGQCEPRYPKSRSSVFMIVFEGLRHLIFHDCDSDQGMDVLALCMSQILRQLTVALQQSAKKGYGKQLRDRPIEQLRQKVNAGISHWSWSYHPAIVHVLGSEAGL